MFTISASSAVLNTNEMMPCTVAVRRMILSVMPTTLPILIAVMGLIEATRVFRLSRAVAMIVWGSGKREAFNRIDRATAYDPSWPATIAVGRCRW